MSAAVCGTKPPVRWQSSQRPLFVRTVWVDGLRHAVLSADDPLFQCRSPVAPSSGRRCCSRSSVSTVTSSSSGSAHSCDLEQCLVKLQLVITSNKSPTKSNTPTSSSCRSRQDIGHYCEEHQESEGSISVGAASVVGDYRRPYLPYVVPSSSEDEREQEPVEDDTWLVRDVESRLPRLQLNPLSERVLQWLDLVGRSVGVVDGSAPVASVSRCGKRNGKERATSRYAATAVSRPTSEVPASRRFSSKRQRNADAALQANSEASPLDICLWQDAVQVTAAEPNTVRVLEDLPAGTDGTVRCASPVKGDFSFQSSDLSVDSAASVKCGVSRPQLHIFLPCLPRDRPVHRHHDTADSGSECASCCSDA